MMYYVYAANSNSLPFVKAENSKSFDIGFEKSFLEYGLNLDLTYFNVQYKNVLERLENIIIAQGLIIQHKMPMV